MKRFLGLFMPYLPIERFRPTTGWDGSSPEPIATVEQRGGVVRVTACNPAAARLGVHPGMTATEAGACTGGGADAGGRTRGGASTGGGLTLFPADPAVDRRALEALAAWADVLSPIVHLEDDRTLLIDVSGCQPLFKGEANIVQRAAAGVRARGYTVKAALADTPGAAWALAHAAGEPAVITEPGGDLAELAPLPVQALRLDDNIVSLLAAVGVRTVEALLHLPRSSLPSRFGEALTTRLAQALGEIPELLTPFRPPPVLRRALRFGAATDRLEVLTEAARRLTETLSDDLAKRGAGVRQLYVTFHGLTGPPTTLELCLARPTRAAGHLASLLATRLADLRLPAPAEGITLWTPCVEPLRQRQAELFEPVFADDEALTELIDRLRVALGAEAVVYAEPVDDHQPERGYRWVGCLSRAATVRECSEERHEGTKARRKRRSHGATERRSDEGRGSGASQSEIPNLKSEICNPDGAFRIPHSAFSSNPQSAIHNPQSDRLHRTRPFHLLDPPCEVAVTAVVPDGPPVRFRWEGREQPVARCVGPERIETGWWRGRHVQRDYYRVTTSDGRRFWLFRRRDTCKWFVHGTFD